MQLGLGCRLCPRACGVVRKSGGGGYCGASSEVAVAAVCIHRGEEPPLAGLVNVFFAHCNLHCVYCQNHVISGRTVETSFIHYTTLESLADRIAVLLPSSNGLLGLVTATHYAHLVKPLLNALGERGLKPTVVYNSSGYERPDTLRCLEGLVDIYLPDLKYMDRELAERYSGAADYPTVAAAALTEMHRQVGASLKVDDRGVAFRGMAVRHLVLPGHVDNSLQCLEWIADHLPLTIPISLMAQYFPARHDLPAPLDRTLRAEEYRRVVDRYHELGFGNGWLQALDAECHYRPDFARKDNPFEPST